MADERPRLRRRRPRVVDGAMLAPERFEWFESPAALTEVPVVDTRQPRTWPLTEGVAKYDHPLAGVTDGELDAHLATLWPDVRRGT